MFALAADEGSKVGDKRFLWGVTYEIRLSEAGQTVERKFLYGITFIGLKPKKEAAANRCRSLL
jgi:hypothetical protein